MNFHLIDWLVLGAYLVTLVIIGAYFSKKQHSTEEYFLGSRRFGGIITSITIIGTATSAISFLGVPGFVVGNDWSILASSLAGIPASLLVARWFVPLFYDLRLTSVYEYLARRFDGRVAFLNSVLFVLMRGTLAGVAIYAPSMALSVVTGWNLEACIALSAALTILYTAGGGASAVVWTKMLQATLLFGGALFITIYLASTLPGSPADWLAKLQADNKFNLFDFSFSLTHITFWGSAIGGLFYGVAFYGIDQVLVQRYLSANSTAEAKRSLVLNAFYSLPSLLLLFTLGSILYLFIQARTSEIPTTLSGDQYLPYVIVRYLPWGMPGLMVAAIYAAAMSTLSAVLSSLTTITVNDFIKPRLRRPRSESDYLKIARWVTIGWGTLSILTALGAQHLDSRVTIAAVKAASLFMGEMLGVFLLGMLTVRIRAASVLRACWAGLILSFVAGFASPLDALWLAAFGTLTTLIWGGFEAWVSPATPSEQAAKRPFTWAGHRASNPR